MSEKNNPETESGEDTSAYLYESYQTDDGIEVPPPTRPMGPRRLARYREDAATYLRAVRDGEPLPEEPVAYMPLPDEASTANGEPTAQQRLTALSTQGGIDTSDQHSDIFSQGGRDTRDDVAVTAFDDASGQDSDGYDDVTTEFSLTGDIIEGDINDSPDFVDSSLDEESDQSDETDHAKDDLGELSDDTDYPEPVRAIDSQGLDLSEIETEVDADDAEEKKPWSHDELQDLPTIKESVVKKDSKHDVSEELASSLKTDPDPISPLVEPDSNEESKKNYWIGVLFLVVIFALIAAWFLFFQ